MPKLLNRPEGAFERQRFTFTISGQFPRERELLAHLSQIPGGHTGTAALRLIMIGLQTAGQPTQVDMDDNFPWLSTDNFPPAPNRGVIDAMCSRLFRCQLSLYPHIAEHYKVLEMMSILTNERRADVLRRLSLRGLRIHELGMHLATRALSEAAPFSHTAQQARKNTEPARVSEMQENSADAQQLMKQLFVAVAGLDTDPAHVLQVPDSVSSLQTMQDKALSHSNQNDEDGPKIPAAVLQPGNNESRVRVPAFRQSPEFLLPEDAVASDANLHSETAGVVVIKNTPMTANASRSPAAMGLAAMMGGFAGMNAEDGPT